MASIFIPPRRHALPNFRGFIDTVGLGELEPAVPGSPKIVPVDFESLLLAWKRNQTIGVAGDILSTALVSGESGPGEIAEAAQFILEHRDVSSESLVDAATTLLRGDHSKGLVARQLPRLTTFLATHHSDKLHQRIHALKQAAVRFGGNPVLHTELARLYLIVGNSDKAAKNIRIALALAPRNRFVLRSAARLYAHLRDPERAYDILRRNPGTRHDPWLAAAELAVAGLIDREKDVTKRAAALISSENYSPLSIAELSSELGSVELLHGDRRRSRRLLQTALHKPNENALAQVEWALQKDKLFDFDPKSFDVDRNYEALALEAFDQQEWNRVIEHCESWFMDMPFARRPLMMGSHVATVVLDNFATAQVFCQVGLISNPRDPLLLNNYAYALALDGHPDEALGVLDQVPIASVGEASTRICLVATKGLALFRKGQMAEGRLLYMEAIEAAKKVADVSFNQLALLNYTREEVRAQQLVAPALIEGVKAMKIDPKSITLQILKSKVIELFERTHAAHPQRDLDGANEKAGGRETAGPNLNTN